MPSVTSSVSCPLGWWLRLTALYHIQFALHVMGPLLDWLWESGQVPFSCLSFLIRKMGEVKETPQQRLWQFLRSHLGPVPTQGWP